MRQLTMVVLPVVVAALVLMPVANRAASKYPTPPIDESTGLFAYQGVVEVEGATASELLSRARAWVASTYRSAQDVIQLDDKDAGRLVIKGNFSARYYTDSTSIKHTFTVDVKDGRFRYKLTDLVFDNGYWSAPLEREKKFTGQKKRLFTQVTTKAEAIIEDFKRAMSSSTDDW